MSNTRRQLTITPTIVTVSFSSSRRDLDPAAETQAHAYYVYFSTGICRATLCDR